MVENTPKWVGAAQAISAVSAALVVLLGFVLFGLLPAYPLYSCSWVDSDVVRYLLIADPQMEGPKEDLHSLLNNQMNDIYYEFISSIMGFWNGPFDGVVLLGDLMAHPYSLHRYDDTLRRFRKSFVPVEENLKPNGELFFLAGNHDLGYGGDDYPAINERFQENFGPRHWTKIVNGHLLVGLDGIDLDGTLATTESWEFLSKIKASSLPKILFMHIPLWKPAGSCKGDEPEIVYYQGGGIRTQTLLSEETTTKILNIPNLKAVFTGHDHEGCSYTHPHGIDEYTIRSILGDYGGNTALLSWGPSGVSVKQCPFVSTKYILVVAVALPIALVVSVAASAVVLCSSKHKEKSE
eukprot:TRINITY_DN37686_c0_g1_i1.p1 TRINITY_DN37686_c0_g1~~TRINITY_DN37686_c0_g1_i1.p1  ORF type:complete len:351 (+),score=55.06 TRINITY_DN37686_c0_g1_i1:41-1093(+)